jgi:hypothetical protein
MPIGEEQFQRMMDTFVVSDLSVVEYLKKHDGLSHWLYRAIPCIESSYGTGTKVMLEIGAIDGSAHEHLFATILTDKPHENAIKSMSSFDKWWLENTSVEEKKVMTFCHGPIALQEDKPL